MSEHVNRAASRPLSPHLQIYRWPTTMAASILHRATGLALAAGTIFLAWWLLAAAQGPSQYDFFSAIARSLAGQLILFGFVWALSYHLLSGIRHLSWDVGYGFTLPAANRSGVFVFLLSLVLGIAAFAYVYVEKGLHP